MLIIKTIEALRTQVSAWRRLTASVAFVPTMGNLHAGHLQLVQAAKQAADYVVVSIFVNPTQFAEGEDYTNYPRTEAEDIQKLQAATVDIVFMPSIAAIYPAKTCTTVHVSEISKNHCGAKRIGHFDAVATVVSKLFNIVQPDIACFGEKDFQQLAVIQTMVKDLNSPVHILPVRIMRETDGLAMSSRNSYLNSTQRATASFLYQTLSVAREQLLAEQFTVAHIESAAKQALLKNGFLVDYFSVCRRSDLEYVHVKDKKIIILAAVYLGSTRLIDNIQLDVRRILIE